MAKDLGALGFLEPIESKTRGAQVLEALSEMIRKGGLKIGDRLPPEITLAERLGVGRSTIREALNRWEGLGVIRRKRGAGTYLTANVQTSNSLVPTMVRLEGEALLRLMQVRRALETEVVRMAARNATEGQRTDIAEKCDQLLWIVEARQPWRKADAAFHGAIYDASGNPMFGQILLRLEEALERSEESPFGSPEFGRKSFAMHRDLSDAIVKNDPDMAVTAIYKIMDSVEDEIRELGDLEMQSN